MELTLLHDADGDMAILDGETLDPKYSQKVYNHSPDGFSWGYGGSGPSQLALAVLLRYADKKEALKKYQDFKWEVIAQLPQTSVAIEMDLRGWLAGKPVKQCMRLVKDLSDFDEKTKRKAKQAENQGQCGKKGDECLKAQYSHCDCQCGGANHGKQKLLFP